MLPNLLAAFGVDFDDAWWWTAIRRVLAVVFLVALVVWLAWCGASYGPSGR